MKNKNKKIKFKKYKLEFSEEDFNNLTYKELIECKEILNKIKEKLM